MKKSVKRIISALVAAAAAVSSVFVTLPVSAESEQQYISGLLGLVYHSFAESFDRIEFDTMKSYLSAKGCTTGLEFDYHNSENMSDDYYYPLLIGGLTTTDENEAIRDIFAYYGDEPTPTKEINGITYYAMSGWYYTLTAAGPNTVDNYTPEEVLNVNSLIFFDAAYIYYTKDAAAGKPIVAVEGSTSENMAGFETVQWRIDDAVPDDSLAFEEERWNYSGNANLCLQRTLVKLNVSFDGYMHFKRADTDSFVGSVFSMPSLAFIIAGSALIVAAVGTAIVVTKRRGVKRGN